MKMMFKNSIAGFLLIFALLVGNQLFAQNREVKGKVVDESGQPIIGANVTVKGTTNTTQTNATGDFTIQVPAQGKHELIVSVTGYTSSTVPAEQTDPIRLEKNISSLDDVVVVGYTAQKKKDLTGATSSMAGRDVEKSV